MHGGQNIRGRIREALDPGVKREDLSCSSKEPWRHVEYFSQSNGIKMAFFFFFKEMIFFFFLKKDYSACWVVGGTQEGRLEAGSAVSNEIVTTVHQALCALLHLTFPTTQGKISISIVQMEKLGLRR